MMKNSSGSVASWGSSVAGSLRWLTRRTCSLAAGSCFVQLDPRRQNDAHRRTQPTQVRPALAAGPRLETSTGLVFQPDMFVWMPVERQGIPTMDARLHQSHRG